MQATWWTWWKWWKWHVKRKSQFCSITCIPSRFHEHPSATWTFRSCWCWNLTNSLTSHYLSNLLTPTGDPRSLWHEATWMYLWILAIRCCWVNDVTMWDFHITEIFLYIIYDIHIYNIYINNVNSSWHLSLKSSTKITLGTKHLGTQVSDRASAKTKSTCTAVGAQRANSIGTGGPHEGSQSCEQCEPWCHWMDMSCLF